MRAQVKNPKSNFVSKNEFDSNNNIIAKSFEKIMREFKIELKEVRTEYRAEFKLVREDINSLKNNFAEVMFELKEIREDLAAATYRRSEISNTLESHDNRITTVENKLLT
jgi:hypothetical protein